MERYEIIITEKDKKAKNNVAGEDGRKPESNVAGEEEKEADLKKERNAAAKLVIKTAVSEARSLLVPHIGEIARDSLLQQRVDATLGLVDTAINFAIHPVYGAINLATNVASRAIRYTIENEKEQNRMAVMMQRASYVNRSRD